MNDINLVVPIERLRGSNNEEYNEEDDEIELEIVEVEELEEPVPTQDSCLQVLMYKLFLTRKNVHELIQTIVSK